MICPECNTENYCPCEACSKREKELPKWKWINGHFMACGKCGFTEHCDWWLDLEWKEHRKTIMKNNNHNIR